MTIKKEFGIESTKPTLIKGVVNFSEINKSLSSGEKIDPKVLKKIDLLQNMAKIPIELIFYQHSIEKPVNKKFDHVICSQVLEHLEDPQEAIKNLIYMTKKNLLISVPNQNKRPDIDHIWSFDMEDFSGISNDIFIGENNIYCGVYKDE